MAACEDIEPSDPLEFTPADILKGMEALKEATVLFYQALGPDAEMPACAVVYGIDLDPKTGERIRTIATIGSRPKEDVRWALEQEVQSGKARGYVVVSEAWMVVVGNREQAERIEGPLREHPKRQEIFMLYGALPGFDTFKTWKIIRTTGAVTLEPDFDDKEGTKLAGDSRSINMWKCVWPTQKEAL